MGHVSSFSLHELEAIVASFYSPADLTSRQAAGSQLQAFQQHWLRAGPCQLLQTACSERASTPTLLWCASLVEQWMRHRWFRLHQAERSSCREIIAKVVIAQAAEPPSSENIVRSKRLEVVLSQVLRADWPRAWESFIPDLFAAVSLSASTRLRILLLLAEETLGSAPSHASPREAHIRQVLRTQAPPVLELCYAGLCGASGADDVGQANSALSLLGRLSHWLDPELVSSPAMLEQLPPLLGRPGCRSAVLKLMVDLVTSVAAAPGSAGFTPALLRTMQIVSQCAAGAVGGGSGGGGGWPPSHIADLATALAAMWRCGCERRDVVEYDGGGLLRDALLSLAGLGSRAVPQSELLQVSFEHADCMSQPTAALAEKPAAEAAVGLAPSPSLVEAVKGARFAAIELLVLNLPRPAEMMLWVELDSTDEEVEEELPGEANSEAGEAAAALAVALQQLLKRVSAEKAVEVAGSLLARLGGSAAAPSADLGRVCSTCWALAAVVPALSNAGAASVGSQMIRGVLSTARAASSNTFRLVWAACTSLLVGSCPQHVPQDLVSDVIEALFRWMRDDSEPLRRMAGRALRALCGSNVHTTVFLNAGDSRPSLLGAILAALPATLGSSALTGRHEHSLYEALAHCLKAGEAAGALTTAQLEAGVAQLMAYVHSRWQLVGGQAVDAIQRQHSTIAAGAADAAPYQEVAQLLSLCRAVCEVVGSAPLLPLVELWQQQMMQLVVLSSGALDALTTESSAVKAEQLLGTKMARAMLSVRTEAIRLLLACIHDGAADADMFLLRKPDTLERVAAAPSGPSSIVLRAIQLSSPLLQQLLPLAAQGPPQLRISQVAELLAAHVVLNPAFRADQMSANDLLGNLATLIGRASEAVRQLAGAGEVAAATAHARSALVLLSAGLEARLDALQSSSDAVALALQVLDATCSQKLPLTITTNTISVAIDAVRRGALPPPAFVQLQPSMRRALCAFPATRDMRLLCHALGVAGDGNRTDLHAALLGITSQEFEQLQWQESEEADLEHEVMWSEGGAGLGRCTS